MIYIAKTTLKGIFRDRVFQGIMVVALLFLAIPAVALLSMRQVAELSITLSLSLLSFILLLLSVSLGATSLWKDIERRYTFSVLSLPLSRSSYIVGRFLGFAVFMILSSLVLGTVACLVIKFSSSMFPSPSGQPIVWWYVVAAMLFATMKYILLIAFAMLFSSVSTSFFLPVFGTICAYFASSITQQVYEFVNSPASEKSISPLIKYASTAVYYILPNLAGFDLKVNAIYSIAPNPIGLGLTVLYFFAYISILLSGTCLLFGRREMK